MPQEDNISQLHTYLTKNHKGFTLDSATFRQDMQDENNLRQVWESIGKSNTDFTVDWDTFKGDMVGVSPQSEQLKEEPIEPIMDLEEEMSKSESDFASSTRVDIPQFSLEQLSKEGEPVRDEEPAAEPSIWGNIKEEASQWKEFGKSSIEAVKGLFGEAAQPEVPEEPITPEISPEQLEEEIPEGSWERDFYDRSEQMKQHVTDLGVDEVTYEVADVLHSLENMTPGRPKGGKEEGYLGGTVNSLYKAMGNTLREWQDIGEVVDDGTGGILSLMEQLNNPKDPRNKELLRLRKEWMDADKGEEKDAAAMAYREFRTKTSGLNVAADWLDKTAGAFREMPETVRGDILTGLAGIVPLVAELALTPEARIAGAGARLLGAAKPVVTSVPKLMTLEGFKGYFRGQKESIDEEYKGAEAFLTPYKELGIGAMHGLYMHSIGVGANKLSKAVTEFGLGKEALTTAAGKWTFAGTSATLTGTGFAGLGAHRYYVENVGKVSPEELREGMKRAAAVDFGVGVGLTLPGVGKLAGTSVIEKAMSSAYKRGFQNLYSSSPELIRAINITGLDPFKLRGEVEKLGERVSKEKDPQRRKGLIALMTAKENQLQVNAFTQDIVMNPEKHIANIKQSPLKEGIKTELIDKIKRVAAENDPLVQAIKPFEKESGELQAKREAIEQNEKLPAKAKEIKLQEITEKEKAVQEKIDKATAEFRKKVQKEGLPGKPSYSLKGEEISKEEATKRVSEAKELKDIEGLKIENDPKLDNLIREKFEVLKVPEEALKKPSKEVSLEKEVEVPEKKEKPAEELKKEEGKKKLTKEEVEERMKEVIPDDIEFNTERKKMAEGLLETIKETKEKFTGEKGEKALFNQKAKMWRKEIIGEQSKDMRGKEYDQEYVTKKELDIFEKRAKEDIIKTEQKLKELKEVEDAVQKPEAEKVDVGKQTKPSEKVDKEVREPDIKKETVKEAGEKELKGDIKVIKSVGAALAGFGEKAGGELNEWVNAKKQQALIGITDKKEQTKISNEWEKKRRVINTLFGSGKIKKTKRKDGTIDYGIQGKNIAQEKQRVRMMKDILKIAIQENRPVLSKIHGRVIPALLNKVASAGTAKSLEGTLQYMEDIITKTWAREEAKAHGDAIDKIEKEISKKALEEQRITLRKAKGTLKSSVSPEYIDLLERVRNQVKEGDPIHAEEAREKIMNAIEGRDEPLTVTERLKLQELDFAHIHEMSSLEVEQKLEWIKDIKKGMKSAAQVEKAERAEKWGGRVTKGLTELIPKGKKLLTGSAAGSIKKKLHKGLDFIWDSSWQSLLNKMSIYRPGKEMPGKEWMVQEFYKKTIKLAEDAEIIGQERHKEYKIKMYEKAFGLKGSKLKNKMDIEGSKEGYAPVEFINEKGELQKEYLSQRTAAQKWLEYRNSKLQENFHLPVEEGGMGWTENTMKQLEAYLKPEWKTLANEISKSYEMLHDRYNPAHQKAFGINMAKEEHFVPIYTSNNRALPSEVLADGMLEQPLSQIMNTRHMKRRISHKNPLAFVDILDVYNTYFTRMEKFKNWHEPVNELKHFFKDPKIKEAIRQFHGSEYNKITDWFIKRFEGVDDVWMKSAFEKGLDRWTTNVTKGILYANRSVGIKQAISTVMYLIDMPVHQWVYGVGLSLTRLRKTSKEFEKGAFLKGRGRAYFDIDNIAKAKIRKDEFGRFLNTIHVDKMDSFLGANIRIGDRIPMYTGGYAYYRYKKNQYKKQHPDWSEEKVHKEAFDDFESLSEKTQQSVRTSNISYLRGTHATWRTIAMFTSGAGQIHRISASATREIIAGRNVVKNLRTLAISHVLMGQLFTLVGNNLEWDWKEQKFGLVLGNAKGIAVGGKLLSSISNALLKKPWAKGLGEEMSTVVNLIDDIGSSLLKINKLAEEKGVKPGDTYKYAQFMRDEEVQKEFKKLIASLAVARGIPANELEDIVISAKKIGRGETEHPVLEGFGLDSDYSDEPKIWEPGGFRLREKNK